MAEFNSCAKLLNETDYKRAEAQYEEMLRNGKDPFQLVFDLQNSLQTELAAKLPASNKNPNELLTMGDIKDWTLNQEEAMRDEFRELYNAMGGMSNGEKKASAIWKRWKTDHDNLKNVKYSDLSQEDRLELMFEYVDLQHFFTNIAIALGFDSKELVIMYMLKQKENLRRYENGY